MTSIVISEAFGGFGISTDAAAMMGIDATKYHGDYDRTDPNLVGAVRALGKAASGRYANLVIVEIPDDVKWHVHEYDGYESVHEDHRSWSSNGLQEGCA